MTKDERPAGVLDWGVGRYETTAERLAPAARVVVERAAPRPGERVLDLGCGTGNAALLAARAGATVTGVDPADRLLHVARARAEADGADIDFRAGEAGSLPLEDGCIDVILSVFALIFDPDPASAADEMCRVLDPRGRLVFSAWQPTGVIHEMNSAAADAVRLALGAPAPAEGFRWHDPDAVTDLFGPRGFTVGIEEHELTFSAPSVDEYFEEESQNHPMAVTGMALLEQIGQAEEVRERLRGILVEGNEDPKAFLATSRYVVATLTRHPTG